MDSKYVLFNSSRLSKFIRKIIQVKKFIINLMIELNIVESFEQNFMRLVDLKYHIPLNINIFAR